MHRENLLVNDSSDRQAVKAVGKGFPEFDVVSTFTYPIKISYQVILAAGGKEHGQRTYIHHKSRISC